MTIFEIEISKKNRRRLSADLTRMSADRSIVIHSDVKNCNGTLFTYSKLVNDNNVVHRVVRAYKTPSDEDGERQTVASS